MSLVPKFQIPFRFNSDGAATVEQDSAQEIVNCVEAIVRTPLGSREDDTTFGVPDLTFTEQGGVNKATVERAINASEPRAQVAIDEFPGLVDNLIENIRIEVRGGNA